MIEESGAGLISVVNKPRGRKLGKKKARFDERNFKLERYISKQLIPPPVTCSWLGLKSWPMYGNDTLGDCVEAASGHMIDIWENYANPSEKEPSTQDIISAYSGCTGYDPNYPESDQGTEMLSFLRYWRKFGVGGHNILAFVQLATGDLTQLKQAIWLFGSAMIGVQLPISAQGMSEWSVPDGLGGDGIPGGWGGHCVPVGGYSEKSVPRVRNRVVTWGEVFSVSDYFYQCYCDEAYGVLSMDWIEKGGMNPGGFDLTLLQADLAQL